MNNEYFMKLALKEAKKAQALDEVPVGAVIIDENKNVIGTGYNQPISSTDPTSHAEIVAIRAASKGINNYRLINTTLYVTIEPCIMCMGAIIHSRVKHLVFGASDPKWGAAGSLYAIEKDDRLNHKVIVTAGIMEEESKKNNSGFF